MVRASRKKYEKEFKLSAIKMVTEQGLTQTEVGNRLGVDPSTVGYWIKSYKADGVEAFPGNGKLKSQDEELRVLRNENKRLKMECEFLKKTATWFAKQQN
ncbi:MAG: transposase [Oligoflexales bacterium]|nr:transposase [Oligoflexales bacterium]